MSREMVGLGDSATRLASASASSCWLPTRRRETTLAISRCRSALASGRVAGSTALQ